ncbi:MAG: hypothetical protein HN742_20265 [Lentisphaerae bacterium]|jgi:hypothetical protein|nr:hypothetical protein [Lentisphaerota bacterium]MBT4821301.1 hypothetical protein [Lentisphaerota bacterium]MBT5604543.1 hypothetical protein [Lentisphaerota bacterium]MBT7060916.1 hypothetical protein [Lentisphaerota bacterium]MBT7844226.1 hypothetical protein [Lentisphaerota bacterium]
MSKYSTSKAAGTVLATFVIAMLIAPRAARATDEYELKVYPCPRTALPLTIDGKLDEEAWEEAPLVGGFTLYNKPELVEPQTYFRVLHTDEHLVFGFRCDEPMMRKLIPIPQARDAKAVFRGEAIELFIDPKHEHANYFQFAADASASVYDSKGEDPIWNADVRAATKLHQDHWSLEIAIPWEDLGITPSRGALLGFNICRDRLIDNAKLWCNWSQTKSNFHDPIRFGHLVLAPSPEDMGKISGELRKGDRRGPIMIYSKTGMSQTSYRALAEASLTRLRALLADLAATRDTEPDPGTRNALTKLLDTYEAEIAPFRETLATGAELDAKQGTSIDLRITQIAAKLADAIWSARLSSLLESL